MISIIICTRNRAGSLRETLRAIDEAIGPRDGGTELLVVDNGSSDDTKEVIKSAGARHMRVQYVFEPRRGQAVARNRGLGVMGGDVVVFTDDDVRPGPGWIEAITGPVVRGEADATTGAVRLAPDVLRPWMEPRHRMYLASTENLDPASPQAMIGANMAFSRSVLSRVPRFDEELGPGAMGQNDDTLFSLQLKAAGFRLRFVAAAEVEHHCGPDRVLRTSYVQRVKDEGRSHAYLDYHWWHRCRERSRRAYASALRDVFMERWRTLYRWRHGNEGMPEPEMDARFRLAYIRQYRMEMQRPPAYERQGLVKLTTGRPVG